MTIHLLPRTIFVKLLSNEVGYLLLIALDKLWKEKDELVALNFLLKYHIKDLKITMSSLGKKCNFSPIVVQLKLIT